MSKTVSDLLKNLAQIITLAPNFGVKVFTYVLIIIYKNDETPKCVLLLRQLN
jgi:hypothetical protein